jgi:hypothetical protein
MVWLGLNLVTTTGRSTRMLRRAFTAQTLGQVVQLRASRASDDGQTTIGWQFTGSYRERLPQLGTLQVPFTITRDDTASDADFKRTLHQAVFHALNQNALWRRLPQFQHFTRQVQAGLKPTLPSGFTFAKTQYTFHNSATLARPYWQAGDYAWRGLAALKPAQFFADVHTQATAATTQGAITRQQYPKTNLVTLRVYARHHNAKAAQSRLVALAARTLTPGATTTLPDGYYAVQSRYRNDASWHRAYWFAVNAHRVVQFLPAVTPTFLD